MRRSREKKKKVKKLGVKMRGKRYLDEQDKV